MTKVVYAAEPATGWRRRLGAIPVVPVLVSALLPVLVLSSPAAAADLNMTVRVTVERVEGHDFGEDPDFYSYVEIAGESFNNEDTPATDPFEDTYTIEPNWEFSKQVALSSGTVPIYLEIRDEDGFLRFDDDIADLDPDGDDPDDPTDNDDDTDQSLSFTVDLNTCTVTGDLNGGCGVFTSTGTPDESASIRLRVEVTEPPAAPGIRIRCMHTPLFPQVGDTVTITAEFLDGALTPARADTLEIWVNERTAPDVSATNSLTLTYSHTITGGGSFSYGCRGIDDSVPIFTGWRSVAATAGAGDEIPVLYTGSTYSRVDWVFVGDSDDYSGAADPQFQADVQQIIYNSFYSYDPFLVHQDAMNFWLQVGTGQADPAEDGCDHEVPDSGWADSVMVVHVDSFRDCAMGGSNVFSGENNSFSTIRHESGHRPFGLADEYCCDGGYYQQDVYPNVYEEPEDCADDAPDLGRTAADCREFEEEIENWDDFDWSVSDPAANDLMVDNTTAQAADIRRIEWYFAECRGAKC
ncbi:hypothetical protein ACFQZ8_11430 [Micromonospora azadirachtae]|uniref:Uncharacterized protein n=1 Tax=Micromonospora azadirachtae TaxID=1970735 RepID=A0ABW3A0W3_9ACTN